MMSCVCVCVGVPVSVCTCLCVCVFMSAWRSASVFVLNAYYLLAYLT